MNVAATIRKAAAAAAVLALTTAVPGAGGPAVLHAQEPEPPRGRVPPGEQAEEQRALIHMVSVRGNERVGADQVRAYAGLRVGERADFRDVQAAIRRLWATGEFADVQVYARPAAAGPAGSVEVVIEVEEQPYIAYIDFRGLEHVRASVVRDTAGLRANAPLDPARVAETESVIRRLLADKGIRVRSVTHRVEPIPAVEGEYRLVFDVDEGSRVAIAEVEFRGNEKFSDEALRDAMQTKSEGFLWFRSGLWDESELRADLRERVPAFYGERGYIDFSVTGDSLIVDPETGKARLIVEVSEGPRYRLVDFDIIGNRRFPSEDLRRYFESSRGGLLQSFGIGRTSGQVVAQQPVFDQVNFERATQDVSQLYRNSGYLYAQVMPFVERTETEDAEPAVRVGWQIREGEPAFVNRVEIVGNTFTHENVIRDRIFLLPGDVYSEDRLIQSYRGISGLGFFETPLPLPQIEQLDNGDVDIIFEVNERQTGSINFGTSIGGFGGLAGFLGYDQPNLFGQAKSGHLRWEFGRFSNNFQASYSDPAIRGSRVSGSVSLFSSRQNRFFTFSEGDYRRTGASLRFGLPFPPEPRYSRVFLGYTLSQTSYQTEAGDETSIFAQPDGLLSAVNTSLLRSTLDNPLFPTVGSRQELTAEFAGGPLGGDGDFQKYTFSGSWWVPVGELGAGQPGVRPVRMSLGLSAEAGTIFGSEESLERFPFERFWLGGVQFGEPLRGYEETTITPLGYFPRRGVTGVTLQDRLGDAYLRLSAEYAIRFSDAISLSVFGDAGNIWRDPTAIEPTRLFRGAGIGATLVTPFGPLGLDYAYGFDKDVPGWQLHFKFGQTF